VLDSGPYATFKGALEVLTHLTALFRKHLDTTPGAYRVLSASGAPLDTGEAGLAS